ncbi:hypothetical protein [Natranaerobius thermophilus]|uniref:Uncharacterized protein n=1 Tax=Natranaerobius thermophilus (strain ATCC BAA-1301 / DSM 18059 / JW/NM-WN-LF) TaxID=457570 RepID=B2A7Y4_NATTJ|nr:hypothetical protein [Natranaerobius thermophilus]ACB85756.1 conserved hypothetical protein [Natranaerobius thermophilus JW/NM-WN-LF]
MKSLFTLKSHESKRLIAKGVSQLPELNQALKEGKIALAGGTTNGYIAEELTGQQLEKGFYTAGIITEGVQCTTSGHERLSPMLLNNGKVTQENLMDAVKGFTGNDVFIKGANALDPDYNAGVLLGSDVGGTMSIYPLLTARGCHLIIPVGREKLIPSVPEASESLGIDTIDKRIGMACGMLAITNGKVITEVEALELLFDVKATHVASGGIHGSEGACTFTIEGEEDQIEKAFNLIKELKKEPALAGERKECSQCGSPCDR